MDQRAHDRTARFLYEMGLLKRARRTGWWVAGVKDPESIAEHSFRTAVVGTVLALAAGADPGRTALLCLLHDSQETRIGDVPAIGRDYVRTASNRRVTADQVADLPERVGHALRDLVEEYEAQESQEAILARDADKLECLLQAREYEAQGFRDVPPWIESSAAALSTDVAKQLADAAREVDPSRWWRDLVGLQ